LGLPAALAYSKIAPDAAHAQHMTTHIFVALGMWDEVVSQNEIASGPDRAAWTPHHYTQWLGYGYLQQGRDADALRLLELMHQNLAKSRGRGRAVLAEMRADYVVNSERWDCPCLQWGLDVSDARSRDRAADAFVVGFSALQRGDRAGADRSLAGLAALNRLRAGADPSYARDAAPDIIERELRALLREAAGAREEAVALMRQATALEDAMPLEAGPPAVVKPSHELLGEILLRAGQPRAAEAEFTRALQLAPRRARSLLGLGRAAALAGDPKAGAAAYGELRQMWRHADPTLPGLAEAARFLAPRP
jgi:tetratricopeptide (TPR) repeat protein